MLIKRTNEALTNNERKMDFFWLLLDMSVSSFCGENTAKVSPGTCQKTVRSLISAYRSVVWMCVRVYVCGLDEFTVLMHHIIAHKHSNRSACGVPPAHKWGHAWLQMEILLIHLLSLTLSFAASLETTQHTLFNTPADPSQKDRNNAFLWHHNLQVNEANTQLNHI